jgi:hypothetical protein
MATYVVEYLPKHFLGRDDQAHDFPGGHLKVHLGELEHALEEARHLDFIAARRWHGAKVGGPARRPWEGYMRVHGGLLVGREGAAAVAATGTKR